MYLNDIALLIDQHCLFYTIFYKVIHRGKRIVVDGYFWIEKLNDSND